MKAQKTVQKFEQTPLEKIIQDEQQVRTKQASQKIDEYEKLIAALPDLIAAYGIQVKQLCSSVGIARGTFYNRVKRLDFTPADLRQVYKFIENTPSAQKNTSGSNEPEGADSKRKLLPKFRITKGS